VFSILPETLKYENGCSWRCAWVSLNGAEPGVEGSLVSSSGTADEGHGHASTSAESMQLNAVAKIYMKIQNLTSSVFKLFTGWKPQ